MKTNREKIADLQAKENERQAKIGAKIGAEIVSQIETISNRDLTKKDCKIISGFLQKHSDDLIALFAVKRTPPVADTSPEANSPQRPQGAGT